MISKRGRELQAETTITPTATMAARDRNVPAPRKSEKAAPVFSVNVKFRITGIISTVRPWNVLSAQTFVSWSTVTTVVAMARSVRSR